jgi:hypothetical protein
MSKRRWSSRARLIAVVECLRVRADRRQGRLQLVADGQEEGALGIAGARELRGHLVERLGEVAQLPRAAERQLGGLLPARKSRACARDAEDGTRDAGREHGGHGRGEEAAERTRRRECDPERRALRAHRARSPQEDDDVAATALRRVEVLAAVDGDPSSRAVGKKQTRLLLREDREAFVLRREEPPEGAGRRMDLLVGQERDLSPKSGEGAVLERASDEVGAEQQRQGDGAEDGCADRQSQASLQRPHGTRSSKR